MSVFHPDRTLARPEHEEIPDCPRGKRSGDEPLDSTAFSVRTLAMILTPEMCRAARGLLSWKTHQLAGAAGLGPATVRRFEAGGTIRLSSVEAMLQALQGGGIEFIPAGGQSLVGGPGLRTMPLAEPEVAAAEEALTLEEVPVLASVESSRSPSES